MLGHSFYLIFSEEFSALAVGHRLEYFQVKQFELEVKEMFIKTPRFLLA